MPDVARALDLPSGQRFEYWKHVLSNTFVPLEVWSPGGEDDFRGLLRGCELGSLRFIEVSAEAHTARRTARLVKAAPDRAHRALMLQITSFIEEHLGEAGLAPAQIAAAHHISLRQLHKLFHASGTTVAGWIRQRRLERCGHDLRDPRWSGRPVASIGARWGDPDPAHFSRLFKAAYGVGPRDYRAVAYPPGQAACAGVQDGRRPGT